MKANSFYQQKYTIKDGLERKDLKIGEFTYNLVDLVLFYKVSDTRILMAVRHQAGKNRNRYEAVYYNGFTENDTFVIRDAEPDNEPIWFEDQLSFNEFIEKEGLAGAEFTPRNTAEDINKLDIDDTIPRLWEDFKELDKERIKKGCWGAVFVDTSTDEVYTTEGDLHSGDTWKDYFEWLIGDIEEIIDGGLKNIMVQEVNYHGIDDEEYFAS